MAPSRNTLSGEAYVALEKMIDMTSVREVIHSIGVICQEKAAHISENWQDERLATTWDRVGDKIRTFAGKVPV